MASSTLATAVVTTASTAATTTTGTCTSSSDGSSSSSSGNDSNHSTGGGGAGGGAGAASDNSKLVATSTAQLVGCIVARRVMGRKLAFAHVAIFAHKCMLQPPQAACCLLGCGAGVCGGRGGVVDHVHPFPVVRLCVALEGLAPGPPAGSHPAVPYNAPTSSAEAQQPTRLKQLVHLGDVVACGVVPPAAGYSTPSAAWWRRVSRWSTKGFEATASTLNDLKIKHCCSAKSTTSSTAPASGAGAGAGAGAAQAAVGAATGDSAKQSSSVLLCRRWALGRCTLESRFPEPYRVVPLKSGCQRRHYFVDADEEKKVQQWAAATVARTQASLKANATLQAEYSHDHDVPGDGDKLPKSARAQAFADWLVDTYSLEFLRSGCGVLDVAGGKGALAGLLALKAIPATVIDPRKPRGKCPPPRTAAALERAGRTKYLKFVHSMFDGDTGSTEVIKLAQGCSLIVGLHPDEATEPIVATAVRYKKPFAVVPCCVFPDLFPHRKQSDGKSPVVSINDFVEYLMRLAGQGGADDGDGDGGGGGAMTAALPFAGRNKVVYTTTLS